MEKSKFVSLSFDSLNKAYDITWLWSFLSQFLWLLRSLESYLAFDPQTLLWLNIAFLWWLSRRQLKFLVLSYLFCKVHIIPFRLSPPPTRAHIALQVLEHHNALYRLLLRISTLARWSHSSQVLSAHSCLSCTFSHIIFPSKNTFGHLPNHTMYIHPSRLFRPPSTLGPSVL